MLLETNQLTLQIGDRQLLRALDWRVEAGQCWAIIGCNGAGKTTLLRALAGLGGATLNAGSIRIDGHALEHLSLLELARRRSFLAQGRNDAFAYRVIELVLAARHPYHDGKYWESEADINAALNALAELDVAELAQRDVRSLSGGERQRVAIAQTLAQDAALMLLDEPGNALDLAHQVNVMQLLARLCRDKGRAVLLAGHDLNLVAGFASHVLLLMGDGSWLTGTSDVVLNEANLSRCLQYPVKQFTHGQQRIFLPAL